MTQQTQFLLAWQKTLTNMRQTLAEQFNKPNFKLDFNSKDSKYALAVILEHDMLDDVFVGGQKEHALSAFHTMEILNERSDLREVGHNYASIVNIAAKVMKHEISAMNTKAASKQPVSAMREAELALEC